jgi:NADH-ubiquinone oxidoreductase chain 2
MGGLPPFLGFLAKIVIIKKLLRARIIATLIVLMASSFVSLLYYTRVCYSAFLMRVKATKSLLKPHEITKNIAL